MQKTGSILAVSDELRNFDAAVDCYDEALKIHPTGRIRMVAKGLYTRKSRSVRGRR